MLFSFSDPFEDVKTRLARLDMGPEFRRAVDDLMHLAQKKTSVKWGVVLYDLLVSPVALALLVVLGHPLLLINSDDTSRWKTTEMPNDWLAAVSSLPTVSREGLEFLSRALEAKGWVSIDEARLFIDLEVGAKEMTDKQRAKDDRAARKHALLEAQATQERRSSEEKAAKSASGASMVLARAKQELTKS